MLNVNIGTILVALLLRKLGVRNEFKVSVFMGVDNPWSVLWLLMGARLLAGRGRRHQHGRPQPLELRRLDTLLACRGRAARRSASRDDVRFEHHVTEAYKSSCGSPTTAAPRW